MIDGQANIEDILVCCLKYIPGITIQYLCFAVIVNQLMYEQGMSP